MEQQLIWAVYNRDLGKAWRLLVRDHVNVNAKDEKHGVPALVFASSLGHEEMVRLLLNHKADINAVDKRGNTALIFASRKGHKQIVELLLDENAHVNAVEQYGMTALDYAKREGHSDIVPLLKKRTRLVSTVKTRTALDAKTKKLKEIVESTRSRASKREKQKGVRAENKLQLFLSLRDTQTYKPISVLESEISNTEKRLGEVETHKDRELLIQELDKKKQQHQNELKAKARLEMKGESIWSRFKSLKKTKHDCQNDSLLRKDYPGVEQKSETNKKRTNGANPCYQMEDPTMTAISYEQLLEVRQLASREFGHVGVTKATMRDVNDRIVMPICQESGTSYARYKNPNGCHVEAFVTHSWDEPFDDFVKSIEEVFHKQDKKPNLWICAFALNQSDSKTVENQLGVNERSSLEATPFVTALKAASTFVVVRNSATDLYSRIWCVCELMYANKFGLIQSNMTFVTGPDAFADLRTSCIDAQSYNTKDKAKILRELLTEHNFEEIDDFIHKFRQHRGPL